METGVVKTYGFTAKGQEARMSGDIDKTFKGRESAHILTTIPIGVLKSPDSQFLKLSFSVSKDSKTKEGVIKVYTQGGKSYPDFIMAEIIFGKVKRIETIKLGFWDRLNEFQNLNSDTPLKAGDIYMTFSDIDLRISINDHETGDIIEFAKDFI
ncbi:hypothetical protein D0962_22790 [Leptolyngbyaceae cyanobacterium CCMR0082]|uniref:Uncharacterized protein n=2 Tax=Adonisia TaxID=2950183 RepID=A0A6M0SAL5_9CYAN|nr:hypothetical protein [Adonisia turfae CCMR0082]